MCLFAIGVPQKKKKKKLERSWYEVGCIQKVDSGIYPLTPLVGQPTSDPQIVHVCSTLAKEH